MARNAVIDMLKSFEKGGKLSQEAVCGGGKYKLIIVCVNAVDLETGNHWEDLGATGQGKCSFIC